MDKDTGKKMLTAHKREEMILGGEGGKEGGGGGGSWWQGGVGEALKMLSLSGTCKIASEIL